MAWHVVGGIPDFAYIVIPDTVMAWHAVRGIPDLAYIVIYSYGLYSYGLAGRRGAYQVRHSRFPQGVLCFRISYILGWSGTASYGMRVSVTLLTRLNLVMAYIVIAYVFMAYTAMAYMLLFCHGSV